MAANIGVTSGSGFFKVIYEETIETKKMMIPIEFVKNYGDVFLSEVNLVVSNGRVWKVGLTNSENQIWFDRNWNDFVEYYSIRERYFLTFEYYGFFTFGVHIFASSGCEIQYPSTATTTEPEMEAVGSPKNPTHQCEAEVTENMTSQKIERAIDACRKFKPEKPSFKIILGKSDYCLHNVYVPTKFAREVLKEVPKSFKLKVSDGREWSLNINQRKGKRLSFGSGWSAFYKENNLKGKDVCVFELIKKNVLKVFIFHDKK